MGMRLVGIIVGVLIAGQPALAQNASPTKPVQPAAAAPAKKPRVAAKPKPAKPAAAKPANTAPAATPKPDEGAPAEQTGAVARRKPAAPAKKGKTPAAVQEAYAAMPEAERLAIQSDLAWTGDYNGIVDGDFNERSVAAVKAYQKRLKDKETGILNPQERAQLAAAAKAPQESVGWRLIDDGKTGARLGLPFKLAPQAGAAQNGSRWSSAQGQIQIETFRLREASLPVLFEQLKKTPPQRRVGYSVLKPDFFVISGMQVLKRFYVRAQAKGSEIRGITILYDQATEGIMEPVVVAMSNAFQGFPGPNAGLLPGQKRRVEYGTAIVASAAGDLLADRQLTEECQVIVVPGLGHADRVAEDKTNDLALLRVYGARNLVPAPLAGDVGSIPEATLVGIADPQTQAAGSAVTKVAARLSAQNIEPVPQLGFSGAAAVDAQGRVIGMVELKAPVIASTGIATPQALLVPAEAIRAFLSANKVAPAATAGRGDIERSVARVICVRK
jgi:peptidoglycan hydrolase-like protein with peptidoglycan-binding domain